MGSEMAAARTIRESRLGKHELRLAEKDGRFFGLADGKVCVEGVDPDQVWQALHDDAGKSDPKYFGYSGARNRFLQFFPDGFHSDHYAAQERDYKLAAKARLDNGAPLEAALNGSGQGGAVLAAFRATNMLSLFEKTRLKDVLQGPNADSVVQAAAAFTMDANKASLARLELLLAPYDAAKWTIVTYLPFLWRPDQHMFLKPRTTQDFATRVGHPYASVYEAKLNIDVYSSLLDLAERTDRELTGLKPRDRIDIQSFIWIVGNYGKDASEDQDEAE